MKKWRPVFLLAISALLLAGTLSAQRATGQIFGKVMDDKGEVLPGVSVTAKGPRLVGTATAVTNAQGAFRLIVEHTSGRLPAACPEGHHRRSRADHNR